MAAQATALDEEETYSDEKCVAENDLNRIKDAHFKVMNLQIVSDILKNLIDL